MLIQRTLFTVHSPHRSNSVLYSFLFILHAELLHLLILNNRPLETVLVTIVPSHSH